MSTSTSLSLLLTNPLSLSSPFLLHPHRHPRLNFPKSHFQFPSAITDKASWFLSDNNPSLNFNGWDFPQTPPPQFPKKNSGFPKYLVAGIGTSIVILLAAFTRFNFFNNGFRFPYRNTSDGSSVEIDVQMTETMPTISEVSEESNEVIEKSEFDSSHVVIESPNSEKNKPRVINVDVDSNQHEAVQLLKKLKIFEDDVKASELCTRRQYARWLVQASSMLERNPKYKISTSASLSGSVISAFEDVAIEDPDFYFIQALAETGVVPSKLSAKHKLNGGVKFFPERFISRLDLIDWKSQLEYDFSTIENQEIQKIKLDLMDLRDISPNEKPGLFMDMLAGDRSLLRRVFGQIRRLQPNKPTTIAQVAVTLTSGQMIQAIQNELLRIQTEELSRNSEKEEIKQELLSRGEIERYWVEKIEEEKQRGIEVNLLYLEALKRLEEERIVQEGALNEFLKEKAAIECQKQLLECLKTEIDEMSERLALERTEQILEEQKTQSLRSELQTKKEGVVDAKALLEAEIEALRILRSWIEDEAKKSQARSKVLEEVGRRWKWDRQ